LISPQFREYERMGRVLWIDASNPSPTAPGGSASRTMVKGPEDHAGILSGLVQACNKLEGTGTAGFRVGYLGLANSLAHSEPQQSYSFLQNLVAILKPRAAIAMYTVDGGVLAEGPLESLQTRMDGAILFKQERGRTFLSVQGLGEVQSRDWVEYRATNRAVMVGSFSLERIR
ncbi:MAG: hypothetical protein L3J96_05495, partial [Thermoplasmata archaeon]|nr:hypothetical protein [Thermoplasmata archaeon]